MIVAVQWTLATPQDWVDIDLAPGGQSARRWLNLAKKSEPVGGEVIDNNPGWIFDICIQGVHLYGHDHVAGELISGGGVRFYGWSDDLADDETDYRWGEVWEFYPPAPHPVLGGPVNTVQRKTVYTEGDPAVFLRPDGTPHHTCFGGWATEPVLVRPWSEWVMPPESLTRHGIWVRDEQLWQAHFDARRKRSWREWVA